MSISSTNLTIIIFSCFLLLSCSTVKKLGENEYLLEKNIILKNQKELIKDPLYLLLKGNPNKKILGIPFQMHLYNLSTPKSDSILNPKKYNNRLNNWLKNNSQAPVLIDSNLIDKNISRLEQFFKNQGYFNTKVEFKTEFIDNNKVIVKYIADTNEQFQIDSITKNIASKDIDSLYQSQSSKTLIIPGNPFEIKVFDKERNRLTKFFRNNGVYNFQQNSLRFTAAIDSSGKDIKIPVTLEINNLQKREKDSLKFVPYKIHKIKKINLYIDNPGNMGQISTYTDSIIYKDYTIFSKGKLRYKAKTLEDAIFIKKESLYSDLRRSQTYRYLSNLKNFKYPSITYFPMDLNSSDLEANIYLNPKEKFSMGFDLDLSHSNIQDLGISLGSSLAIRNIFQGAEILEIGLKNTLGASNDLSQRNNDFFNLYELGSDINLRIPRILLPLKTRELIPTKMNPRTNITFGVTMQQNIGLDKQYFGFNYQLNWEPNDFTKMDLKIFDVEYINNQNIGNYFNVYKNSYDRLNIIAEQFNEDNTLLDSSGNLIIPEGTNRFIDNVLNNLTSLSEETESYKSINLIKERKDRLTTNNFIMGSSFSINYNNQKSVLDENFFQLRWKLSWTGSLLTEILKFLNRERNDFEQYEIGGIAPSQYVKTEIDYIKHWQIKRNNVIAIRFFGGIAVPFGNSNNIPFSRSYFSGGANDNRAWRAYSLGPGKSKNINEFNEANFKLSLNFEYRFKVLGKMNGALFVDAGNIWNVLDNIEDDNSRFNGFNDLNEIAIGSGFGLRYDFDFFVFRFDTGFKTYNPSLEIKERWWSEYALRKAVFNIGINYPF
ncbi:MAG: BamA/TamA family outer membrane protein [Bacteroidota bacterium]|nr:BamA/TamA family outer membrane protein [Bacteroidota bacterium]